MAILIIKPLHYPMEDIIIKKPYIYYQIAYKITLSSILNQVQHGHQAVLINTIYKIKTTLMK